MPLDPGVSALLAEEYARFWRGVRNLDPETQAAYQAAARQRGLAPGEAPSISLPGWNDILKIGPRYPVTRAEAQEYYAAKRQGRPPNLSPEAVAAIKDREQFMEAMRTSGVPAYLGGWGDILTAIDNIQDLTATIAALGRLLLWGAPRLLGRFVPIVGWVLLASDLLNLLAFLGTLATPLYALLCAGPSAALAAGVPGLVFKRALKQKTWKGMLNNPRSRLAAMKLGPVTRIRPGIDITLSPAALQLERARRFGRLPKFYNVIELAQVADTLFGYGLSLGALVGLFFQLSFAAQRELRAEVARASGQTVPAGSIALGLHLAQSSTDINPTDLYQAMGVLAGAAKVQAVQDDLPDEIHLLTLTALVGAIPILAHALRGYDWQADFAEVAHGPWAPIFTDDPVRDGWMAAHDPPLVMPRGFALPGNPLTVNGEDYIMDLGPRVTAATMNFIRERRNTGAGVYAATLVNQTTEHLWHFLTGDDHALRWELSTDARLTASLCEEGYLVNVREPEAKIWAFWQRARAAIEMDGGTRLPADTWLRFAAEAGLTLIKLLPPGSPWPQEWEGFLAQEGGPVPTVVS